MPSEKKLARKGEYFKKLTTLLDEYPQIIIVECDNVSSNQMQKVRGVLRGKAVLLMGKKTMMRKAIRQHVHQNPQVEHLLPHLYGNIGFVFTNQDLNEVRDLVTSLKVGAPAKAGTVAPNDVVVPAGPTGLEPTQTSFLQALNIGTKIVKGQIEILAPATLIHAGEKVGQSEATLLSKLNIRPFSYGLVPRVVYDHGIIYESKVLDMTLNDVRAVISKGVSNIAALGLQIGYPTMASVPHSIMNGFKNLVSIAIGTEYTFKEAEQMKDMILHPEKFAAVAAAAAAAAPAAAAKEESKEDKKEEKEEEEEEEEGDFGLDLFA